MNVVRSLRRMALLVSLAAIAAGCATPQESNAPEDLNRDRDRNGIPDEEEQGVANVTKNTTTTNETEMPGVVPTY